MATPPDMSVWEHEGWVFVVLETPPGCLTRCVTLLDEAREGQGGRQVEVWEGAFKDATRIA